MGGAGSDYAVDFVAVIKGFAGKLLCKVAVVQNEIAAVRGVFKDIIQSFVVKAAFKYDGKSLFARFFSCHCISSNKKASPVLSEEEKLVVFNFQASNSKNNYTTNIRFYNR